MIACCKPAPSLTLLSFSLLLLSPAPADAVPWPGGSGTSIAVSGGESDLSGAVFNAEDETLWVLRQNRVVWQYEYDSGASTYALVQTLTLPAGIGSDIEAIAIVDPSSTDELYTLSENEGRLARTVGIGTAPAVLHTWGFEALNNGHSLPGESSGLGAEALAFVPDAFLLAAGFRFPNGAAFSGSTFGMGGLIFVGHQIDGRLHVFDVNPDVDDDFVNHGSFLSAASEIAGLEFDRIGGLMYIWHNTGGNSLELSTLSSDGLVGTLDVESLYDSSMPAGNLEGLAIVTLDQCGLLGSADSERTVFLTRDGGSPNLIAYDEYPCDCTGALTQERFESCVSVGGLAAGCVCLDSDVDGDVDCDDVDPGLSPLCSTTAVPSFGRFGQWMLGLWVLLFGASASRPQRPSTRLGPWLAEARDFEPLRLRRQFARAPRYEPDRRGAGDGKVRAIPPRSPSSFELSA